VIPGLPDDLGGVVREVPGNVVSGPPAAPAHVRANATLTGRTSALIDAVIRAQTVAALLADNCRASVDGGHAGTI
jgi:hypothetical protein